MMIKVIEIIFKLNVPCTQHLIISQTYYTNQMKKTLLTSVFVISFMFGYQAIHNHANSRSSGAPSGHASDPASGSSTCTSCHNENDGPLPAGQGGITLSLNGNPVTAYYPDSTYDVVANCTASSASSMYGFETTPQNTSGTYLGILTAGAGNKVTGTKYLTHTSPKNGSSATWNFKWTAPSAGAGTVTFYTCFDAVSTKIYSVSNSFTELGGGANGINAINSTKAIVFPNPIVNELNIVTNSNDKSDISIYSLNGNLVKQFVSNNVKNSFNVSDLNSGVYILNITSNGKSSSLKIVKQ